MYSAPSAGSSHFHSEQYSKHGSSGLSAPIVTYPVGGSSLSSRFSEHSSLSNGGLTAPVITYPSSGSSSHSSRFSESSSSSNGGYSAPIVAYPSGGSSSSSHFSESSSSSNRGLNAPIIAYPGGGSSSSHFSQSSSSSNGNFGGNVGFASYPQALSSRFSSASDFDSGLGSSFGTSNLHQYMSESERLARLQSQNIQGQHGYKGTSTAHFGNAALVQPSASGGRTKSWEKSSKWASQTDVCLPTIY